MSREVGPALDRRFLAPDHPDLAWDGLAALSRRDGWWQPWRITPDRLATALSPALLDRAAVPAGARLRLRTDARELTLRIAVGQRGAGPFDVLVDDAPAVRLPVAPGVHDLCVPLPGRPARVEVWLPQRGSVRLGHLSLPDGAVLTPDPPPPGSPAWIAYGGRLTQRATEAGPGGAWPALVARRQGWRLTNLGFAHEARLDLAVARALRSASADLITLELAETVRQLGRPGSALCGFVETVRDAHPRVPLAVLVPARCAGGAVDEAVTLLHRLGDRRLHLLDLPDPLSGGDGASDGVDASLAAWAGPELTRILAESVAATSGPSAAPPRAGHAEPA
ncbi:SGNH/GDSL hydrolase family protein [Streptomyces sp. NPDC058420]|uniref:SGNH/GDSL hydrolase family protein n=1 Tax=Streptomyces sp. NPDC058420 TaxID=3346489 RepID=UPI003658E8B9